AIFGLSGIDRRLTTANAVDGFAQFMITFEFSKPATEASQEVRDAISTIRGDLPTEMEEPVITRFDWGDQPILSLTLSSPTLDAKSITMIADPGVVGELRTVTGVARASVVGGSYPELTVEIRPEAMQADGEGLQEVEWDLVAQNLVAAAGRLHAATTEQSIRLAGRLTDASQFRDLVVANRDGRVVRLSDIADVREGVEEARTSSSHNGARAVAIDVVKSKGHSTSTVVANLKARIAELQQTVPEGTRLEIVRDAGERVDASVNNTKDALMEGAILTILVVLVFLNSWRSTVITGLALPISVLAGFIGVWALGFTLNSMSLLGLTLAIGILIDDAIVVRENIVRHVAMGKDHYTAAREGTAEIALAVTATTFSIVAVFVPVGMLSGEVGQWMKPFALSLVGAVLVSLFVSFSLDPMLSAYWPDPHKEEHQKSWLTRLLDRFDRWFNRLTDKYATVVGWARS